MNLIPKIAEMLGVEVGEEFQIDFKDDKKLFVFSETALLEKGGKEPIYRTLADLVYGVRKIIKLPFEPKDGEKYWYVYWNANDPLDTTYTYWDSAVSNWADKFCGNCFRTEAEAEVHKYEIYEKLTGKKWVVAE